MSSVMLWKSNRETGIRDAVKETGMLLISWKGMSDVIRGQQASMRQ